MLIAKSGPPSLRMTVAEGTMGSTLRSCSDAMQGERFLPDKGDDRLCAIVLPPDALHPQRVLSQSAAAACLTLARELSVC